MYIVAEGLYPELYIEKIIKEDETLSLSLSLKVAHNSLSKEKLDFVSNNIRLFAIGTRRGSKHSALKENADNALKSSVEQKKADLWVHLDTSFDPTLIKEPQYTRAEADGSEFDYYKIGTYTLPRTADMYNTKHMLVGATILRPSEDVQNILSSTLTVSVFNLKENNRFFPFGESETTLGPEMFNKVIYLDTFRGQSSFLARFNDAKTDFTKKSIIHRKPTAFSDLMPAVRNNTFSFGCFYDLETILSNNSDAFASLSDNFKQKALESTTIVRKSIFKKRVKTHIEGNQEFDFIKEEIKHLHDLTEEISDLQPNLHFFSGQHDINDYESNLLYQYEIDLTLKNGITAAVENLQQSIVEIDTLRSFMKDIYGRPLFYDAVNDYFIHNSLPLLRKRIVEQNKNIENSSVPSAPMPPGTEDLDDDEIFSELDIASYYVKLLENMIFSIKEFVDPENLPLTMIALEQMKRSISLRPEQSTDKNTFNLFFSVYDSVKEILNNILLTTGYSLLLSTRNKTGAGGSLENQIIRIRHDFNYIFRPGDYLMRYSHFEKGTPRASSEQRTLSFRTLNDYASLLKGNMRKYFITDAPVTNETLASYELSNGTAITLDRSNFLNAQAIKIANRSVVDLSVNFGWDPDRFLDFALEIVLFKVFRKFPSPSELELRNQIRQNLKEVINSLSIRGESILGFGHFDSLFTYPLNDSTTSSPSADERSELEGALDTTRPEETPSFVNVFLDLLDDYIENYPHNLNNYKISRRTTKVLRDLFLDRGVEKADPLLTNDPITGEELELSRTSTLPYPLYALYENTVPLGATTTTAFIRQTNFNWNERRVFENPLNIPTMRLNFANIVKMERFIGFDTYRDGSLNLARPIYQEFDFEGILNNPAFEQAKFLCRLKNYNFNNYKDAWYLNNSNLLSSTFESETFIMDTVDMDSQNRVFLTGETLNFRPFGPSLREQAAQNAAAGADGAAERATESAAEREATSGRGAPGVRRGLGDQRTSESPITLGQTGGSRPPDAQPPTRPPDRAPARAATEDPLSRGIRSGGIYTGQ
jgi:hypothetical protein